MNLSTKAQEVYNQVCELTKLGDLRKIAKIIRKDHELAMELWSTNEYYPRQLAILIMDKNALNQAFIDELDKGIQKHEIEERHQLIDWLMANQLTKNKKNIALMESWEKSNSSLQRRIFWYYQARLRWMGKTDQTNTDELLHSIEKNLLNEEPEVQWAMNFTAGQIGKWQKPYRDRCIAIGENKGLYKHEKMVKGCTPNYLPKFIEIEVNKLKK